MTLNFLCLLLAAGILHFLARDARRRFLASVCAHLPRNVGTDHLEILLRDFPEAYPEFRARSLPLYAGHLAINVTACGVFAAALWFFPPAAMNPADLLLVQYGALFVFPVAFVVDLFQFFRVLVRTFSRSPQAE